MILGTKQVPKAAKDFTALLLREEAFNVSKSFPHFLSISWQYLCCLLYTVHEVHSCKKCKKWGCWGCSMTFFIHLIPGRIVKELYVLVIPLIVLVYRKGFSGNNYWLFRAFTSMIFPPSFDVVFFRASLHRCDKGQTTKLPWALVSCP